MRIPKYTEREFRYWLGILIADGCLQQKKNLRYVLRLGFKPTDKDHLQKFLDYLELDNKIYTNPRAGVCEVHICQRQLQEPFILYGMHPRKTMTARAHDSMKYDKDFWRGVFDGDGNLGLYSIGKNKPKAPRTLLCGNKYICHQFLEFLRYKDSEFLINNVVKHGSIYAVVLKGRKALKVIRFLGYHNTDLTLERKQRTALELLG